MKVLVIDVGGSHVKFRATGHEEKRRFVSGPQMSGTQMVEGVIKMLGSWQFDAVTIGYPGAIKGNRPVKEPHNLGRGWIDCDYESAFGKPVKFINDAAMQALGSYEQGVMLFLGLGTGLGTAVIADGTVVPMEIGHLPYRKKTFEEYVSKEGMQSRGKRKWRASVNEMVEYMRAALLPDDIVLGGGNVKYLDKMPIGCRQGNNANAFVGGFRLWKSPAA